MFQLVGNGRVVGVPGNLDLAVLDAGQYRAHACQHAFPAFRDRSLARVEQDLVHQTDTQLAPTFRELDVAFGDLVLHLVFELVSGVLEGGQLARLLLHALGEIVPGRNQGRLVRLQGFLLSLQLRNLPLQGIACGHSRANSVLGLLGLGHQPGTLAVAPVGAVSGNGCHRRGQHPGHARGRAEVHQRNRWRHVRLRQISCRRLVLHAISFRVPARAAQHTGRIRSCHPRQIKR